MIEKYIHGILYHEDKPFLKFTAVIIQNTNWGVYYASFLKLSL